MNSPYLNSLILVFDKTFSKCIGAKILNGIGKKVLSGKNDILNKLLDKYNVVLVYQNDWDENDVLRAIYFSRYADKETIPYKTGNITSETKIYSTLKLASRNYPDIIQPYIDRTTWWFDYEKNLNEIEVNKCIRKLLTGISDSEIIDNTYFKIYIYKKQIAIKNYYLIDIALKLRNCSQQTIYRGKKLTVNIVKKAIRNFYSSVFNI